MSFSRTSSTSGIIRTFQLMPLREGCHEISYLTLRLYAQRVDFVKKELPFHRQSAGIHESLAAPLSIAFSHHRQLHRIP